MVDDSVPLLMAKIAEFASAMGVERINELSGAWIHQVDDHWTIAGNGHREPVDVEPDGCMKIEIAPFTFAAWWNGWLAMVVDARDGWVAAGELANEETLIGALEAATRRSKAGSA